MLKVTHPSCVSTLHVMFLATVKPFSKLVSGSGFEMCAVGAWSSCKVNGSAGRTCDLSTTLRPRGWSTDAQTLPPPADPNTRRNGEQVRTAGASRARLVNYSPLSTQTHPLDGGYRCFDIGSKAKLIPRAV